MAQEINIYLSDDQMLEDVGNAFNSRTRRDILRLCANKSYSIYGLAEALNMAIPTISFHVKILQKAGLVIVLQHPNKKGNEKQVSVSFSRLSISKAAQNQAVQKNFYYSLPIGSFSAFNISSPCCIVDQEGIALALDQPGFFYSPKRILAELISFADGWIEYSVPTYKFKKETIYKFIFSLELCAETPFFNNNWRSDITFWVNGVEICTYNCMGDYGERRGLLTPKLWTHNATQYGFLQKISVGNDGVYLNEKVVNDKVTVSDLALTSGECVTLRIGIKDNAKCKGGVNLFGKNFGDHPQNILVQFVADENLRTEEE